MLEGCPHPWFGCTGGRSAVGNTRLTTTHGYSDARGTRRLGDEETGRRGEVESRSVIAGGEVDPELRAAFVAILAAGLTTMSGGDGAHEAEAEAHAGRVRAGGAAAGEALPDGGQIGRAEAGAGVAHEDAMMFVLHGQRERDAPPRGV
jgi:hypothetical protein